MKVWLKFLIGSLLGLGLGFLLPQGNGTLVEALAWVEGLAIRLGRYGTAPIMFFSLAIAIYELRQDRQLWPLVFRTAPLLLGSAVLVIGAGILATLGFPPARIPISTGAEAGTVSLEVAEGVLELFPSNMFAALGRDGVFLLPVYALAFFMGIGLSYDRSYSRQVISLTDSLSRIFYHITSLFSEVLGLVMIALGAYWAIRFQGPGREEGFRDLVLRLGIFCGVLGFLALPLLLYFLRPKLNPWAALYGSLGPAVAAFFSGDLNFTLPVLLRHVRENLGVRRRSNVVTLCLFSSFGRAGSAMVAAAAFIVIIKSYSSLGVTAADVLSIALRAFLISFLLARHPGDGAYTALAVLCTSYGRGFEAGYLILKPLAFYLIAAGTFLDALIASFASLVIARQSGFHEDKSPARFI